MPGEITAESKLNEGSTFRFTIPYKAGKKCPESEKATKCPESGLSLIHILKERDMKDVIARAYNKSKDQVGLPKEQMVNYVKEIYAPFTNEEIAAKMVELLTPKGTQAKVEICLLYTSSTMARTIPAMYSKRR